MLLALDVGNTNIAAGLYQGAERLTTWRFDTVRAEAPEALAGKILPHIANCKLNEITIASVVPPIEEALRICCERLLGVAPFFVRSERESGIVLHYAPPSSLGVDRLCNVAGHLEKYGAPGIVIDFGTATKLEAIAENGDYLGGAILPGVGVSIEALLLRAARLIEVEWKIPSKAIGQSSAEALQSGFAFGFAGQAEYLVQKFQEEMGVAAQVVATGGFAAQIAPMCPSIDIFDPFLTLDGVCALHARQKRLLPTE